MLQEHGREEGSGNLGQKGRVMKYVAFNQDLKGWITFQWAKGRREETHYVWLEKKWMAWQGRRI